MKYSPRKSRAQWQALVNQQAQSGLSIAKFCHEHKLNQNNFYKWQSALKQEASGFSRVSVNVPVSSGKIRCALPNGLRLEWDESVTLDSLLPLIKGLS